MPKRATSLRLTVPGQVILSKLAVHHGISQAAVVEMLLRREARAEGISFNVGAEPEEEEEEADRPVLYSVGYQQRSPEELIQTLLGAGVTVLVDVRETPWSHRASYSRGNLEKALQAAGVEYVHAKFAGNPKELRRNARSHADCLDAYRSYVSGNEAVLAAFSELLAGLLANGSVVCLFCYERHPHDCHRDVLLQEWSRHSGKMVTVNHLATEGAPRLTN
jgi:hypothetical protein